MAPAEIHDSSVRCIVKLGGDAITQKNELETIDEANLSETAKQVRDALGLSCSEKLSMDWSLQSGEEDGKFPEDDGREAVDIPRFVVVDGAGWIFWSFPSQQSKSERRRHLIIFCESGFCSHKDFSKLLGRVGLDLLLEVTNLNHQVVRAFASESIQAVGISPFAGGWSMAAANAISDLSLVLGDEKSAYVKRVLDAGLMPVLHGDAVFDSNQGCRILSGDITVRHLAHTLKPSYVVFLTNVPGVFDRPPSLPGAVLLKEKVVKNGNWTVIDPPLTGAEVETDVAAHDTTGGMATKIAEAASIAAAGTSVFVVQAGSKHALEALRETVERNREHWVGTIIKN